MHERHDAKILYKMSWIGTLLPLAAFAEEKKTTHYTKMIHTEYNNYI
jgi:hypothetical protein